MRVFRNLFKILIEAFIGGIFVGYFSDIYGEAVIVSV